LGACSPQSNNNADINMGIFEAQTDIGNVSQAGTLGYNPDLDTYSLTASGANIWGDQDDFLA